MESGIVFDIKEFTLHDDPGIRTTVLVKGCPKQYHPSIPPKIGKQFSKDSASGGEVLLVRTFGQVGCYQLQLNSLNLETLIEAKGHPDPHKNLIVRVWGWCSYFCELSPENQDQIISRQLLNQA
jgi:hypothetical protein